MIMSAVLGSPREGSEVCERDAMVLVVVGDETEVRVLVDDARAEHGAVPVAHRRDLVRLQHDVGELAGRHRRLYVVIASW